mgnify:CR=1 FL=1
MGINLLTKTQKIMRNGKRATKGFSNRDMNDDTYKLRRAVMTIIYEFKNRYDIPRQIIRIVDRVHGVKSHDGWHNVIGYVWRACDKYLK